MAENGKKKTNWLHLLALCFMVAGAMETVMGLACTRPDALMLGISFVAIGVVLYIIVKKRSTPGSNPD